MNGVDWLILWAHIVLIALAGVLIGLQAALMLGAFE